MSYHAVGGSTVANGNGVGAGGAFGLWLVKLKGNASHDTTSAFNVNTHALGSSNANP
jgi:hypothetical protein